MMYVVHFALSLLLLVGLVLAERYGSLREGEAFMAWAAYVLVPMLCLANWMKRPAIRRHATAYSLASFALLALAFGFMGYRDAREHHEHFRVRLLMTPIEVEKYITNQLPVSSALNEPSTFMHRDTVPSFAADFPLPEGLDRETEERLRAVIFITRKMMWQYLSDRDYEKARQPFEDSLRKEVTENADRYVRTGRDRQIGIGMMIAGGMALAFAAILFGVRWSRIRRDRSPQSLEK